MCLLITSLSQLHCHSFIKLFLTITFASDLLYRISIISSSLHASLAKTSAASFPLIPMCAGIHMNTIITFTLWSLNNISYMQSCLFFDDIDLIEINAELESEHIITFFVPLSSIQYRAAIIVINSTVYIAKWSVVLWEHSSGRNTHIRNSNLFYKSAKATIEKKLSETCRNPEVRFVHRNIQNAAARLVFNEPKIAHVTPLFVSLHWLPVAARIKFKTLMLAYKTTTGSAPTYFHSLLQIYIPSSNNWKLISFNTTWLHHKKKKKSFPSISSSFSLCFSPSLASLYLFEQCLRLGVRDTSSVCLPLQD